MLSLRSITVTFEGQPVLESLDLTVEDGEVLAILGPSGSGKSTLLRVIAGLERHREGTVSWDGSDLSGIPAHRRRFGLMFQDFALFPHRDVAGNVEFGLRMDGVPREERSARLQEVLALVGLSGFENRSVHTLSGGEQQRVALARALAPRPRLLMLDEPLGSLDRGLRERLALEIRQILLDPAFTALYVTHDQEEAFTVADRVAVLREGRIAQVGTPEELWRSPVDEWVARFLGIGGILEADVRQGTAHTPWGAFRAPSGAIGRAILVLRPEALSLTARGESARHHLTGVAGPSAFRGGHYVVTVHLPGGPDLQLEHPTSPQPVAPLPEPGSPVRVRVEPRGIGVLPPATSDSTSEGPARDDGPA